MNNFSQIQQKLHHFIKKYYTNEIIKGGILFLSLGLLYLLLVLFIEYFFWLKPMARTVLFWAFILVELALLTTFIIFPTLKLLGLQQGISPAKASEIIGKHFTEVDDKLLNILQLNADKNQSDLLLASIEQKSKNLEPIPFSSAINFKYNIKYIKYLIIPIVIWLLFFFTGNNAIFTKSFDRVVHHQTAYNPPAPFQFKVLNKSLKIIEGNNFKVALITVGDVVPENASIHFNGESYFLNKDKSGVYFYEFQMPNQDIDFHFESNQVVSNDYLLQVVATPKITDFKMYLDYPAYTKKKDKLVKNTGNATIPEGTKITWKVSAKNTSKVQYYNLKTLDISTVDAQGNDNFEITKKITQNTVYQINTSNSNLSKYEKLDYNILVVKDQYPNIMVKSDIDSVQRGPVQFVGQLSDDYGLLKLQVLAKNLKNSKTSVVKIKIDKLDFEEFFYVFPEGFDLDKGAQYEIHFEVFDNDQVNGSKKAISKYFYYNNKSKNEIDAEILLEQKERIEDIENSTKSANDLQKQLDDFSDKLKSKSKTDWNDKKDLDQFLERQKKYDQMLKKNTEKLLDNLEEMDKEQDENLEEKKQELKKRLDELKELQKQEDLLKELEKLAEKLKKEDLLDKVEKLAEKSKQDKKSLERLLELTKRFYVEKKTNQISKKLEDLAKEQKDLAKSEENSGKAQEKLNQKFDSIQKDFEDLNKENKALKSPMDIPDSKPEQESIKEDMKNASEDLQKEGGSEPSKKSKKEASKKQEDAAKKMQELSQKMQSAMQAMEAEGSEESIEDLQQILQNLLTFSFEQEALMLDFENITSKHAEYPEKLKTQLKLKENFEYIDDSLYALSLRLVKITSRIQKDITDTHYNLNKSLENIAENKIDDGISNQHYAMTAVNNLTDLLSELLNSMQNKKPGTSKGKGKGKKGESVSLPDIIKKQGELVKKMKKGMKPGEKPGDKPGEKLGKQGQGGKEQMSGELFEIYKQQNALKQQLDALMKGKSEGMGNGDAKKVKSEMEALEKLLLKKGITNETLDRMQKIEHELLKLETATLQQNKDNKRKSDTGKRTKISNGTIKIPEQKIFFNEDEILIKQNFDMQPLYQEKTKQYFKN